MAATSASERVALPMSASKHANAQRSGINPRRSVSSARCRRHAGSRRGHRRSTAPRPAPPRISRRVPSRAERRGAGRRPLGVLHRRRALPVTIASSADTQPAARAAAQARARRSGRARAAAARADAANRPTPSASAASPISASAPASRSGPASADARPSQARASVVPAELAQERRPGAVRQRHQRAARPATHCGEIGQRAAVAALTAGGDGPQPQLMRGRRGGQRPATRGRRRTRRSTAQRWKCHRVPRRYQRRQAETRYRRSTVIAVLPKSTLVNSWCCQC